MKAKNAISHNSEILSGTPVFSGTRVPIKNLFDNLGSGLSSHDFLEEFPSVQKEQMIWVLDLADAALSSQLKHEVTI